MSWFFCPTQVCLSPHALRDNAAVLSGLGKRCLVVTGKTSAAASGVLDDLAAVLPSIGIAYEVFDAVEPNPSIHTCHEGGRQAKAFGAEFVIGAGGGSAMDAAKAVAAYAANDMAPMAIFDVHPAPPLPIAAIPTTAATGSEVNAYAVLTIPELGVKRTWTAPGAFPAAAFLDPRYMASLSYDLAVATALDAFCHCAESYFSPRSTDLTRPLAAKGADLIWRSLLAVEAEHLGHAAQADIQAVRTDLLTGAALGGICIAHTGTGYPHPLGYNLSLSHGIAHGAACAFFEGDYLRRQAAAAPDLFRAFMDAANLTDALFDKLAAFAGLAPRLTAEDVARYAGLIAGAKNFANSIAPAGDDAASIAELYKATFSVGA